MPAAVRPKVSAIRKRCASLQRSRWARWTAISAAALAIALILLAGMFPVGLAKHAIEARIGKQLGTQVTIASIEREPFFSLTPTVMLSDVRAAQPAWAGTGDMLHIDRARLRVLILPLLLGRGARADRIDLEGLALALVRDEKGRSNWHGRGDGQGALSLANLAIADGRFSLRDARRHLDVKGTLRADARIGLVARAAGRFHDAPVDISLNGGAIADLAATARYPLQLEIASPLLSFRARGHTTGALNTADMALEIDARAPSLKYLDDIIQAGLFGSQPVDLHATARRQMRDWSVDGLRGRIGRSTLTGRATILKRHGRSKIDADVRFGELDFDDLADEAGRAREAAIEARIGDRVLPGTRVNLSKVGPTDGRIRFVAERLLFKTPSTFRSLSGVISLEGKVLRIDDIDAALTSGRMTGRMLVDHRIGRSPRLDVDLQFRDARLGPLLGSPERIDGAFGARIALSGRGDTVRDALSRADGHVGLVVGSGEVSKSVAAVFAQDMGKAIGAALGSGNEAVPLQCIAVGFDARQGVLRAAPFLIETAATRSKGEGIIDLRDEHIALVVGGTARDPSGLPLVDPVHIGGTLSAPKIELSSTGGKRGGLFGALLKSIGGALGLAEKKGPQVRATGPVDCRGIARNLLTIGLPPR